MTETSAGKINKEEHLFKSTSGVCDIHTVLLIKKNMKIL